LKHHPSFIRWESASLREAGLDSGGYYLKVDGLNETGETEQIYLMLSEDDVVNVINGWKNIIENRGSDYAKYLLKSGD
jgi:hypothetical protein